MLPIQMPAGTGIGSDPGSSPGPPAAFPWLFYSNMNFRYTPGVFPSPIPGVNPIQQARPRPSASASFTMKFKAMTFPETGVILSVFHGISM